MFQKMITKGNDSTLVYKTKLDLQTVFMACPWKEDRYHLCLENLQEWAEMSNKQVHPFAILYGHDYILWDSRSIDRVHHYYFRRKGENANADTESNSYC